MKSNVLILLLTIVISQLTNTVTAQRSGWWNFNNPDNPTAAVEGFGQDLLLVGTHQIAAGPQANDFAAKIGVGSYYKLTHGISPNGGGSFVNEYSLQIDFKVSATNVWHSFFQTSLQNNNDGDFFINTSGQIGVAAVGYSAESINAGEWYRLVLSVDNGTSFNVYLDGILLTQGNVQDVDGRFALSNAMLMFADEDSEDNEIFVSEIAIWDYSLSPVEVEALGGFSHILPPAGQLVLYPFLQSLTNNSVYICWHDPQSTITTVEFGLTSGLGNTTNGSSEIVSANYRWHSVKLSDLQPNTKYFYRLKSGFGTSQIFNFTTLPDADYQGNIRFLLFSDTQDDSAATGMVVRSARDKMFEMFGPSWSDSVHLVMHTGDIVGSGSTITQWTDQCFKPFSVLSDALPFMSVAGNHELEHQNYYKYIKYDEFSAFPAGHALFEKTWSYHIPGVLFLGLNTNMISNYGTTQKNWLDTKLADAQQDASILFVFVFMHHPPISELWGEGNTAYVSNEILPVLQKYSKVQQLSYGHTHAYERGVIESNTNEGDFRISCVGGGGGDRDRWGEYTNTDYPQIHTALDHYFYVFFDIDLADRSYEGKMFDLGNTNILATNTIADSWHRKLNQQAPDKPTLVSVANQPDLHLLLSATSFSGTDAVMSAQFQISNTSANYTLPVFETTNHWQNIYQVDNQFNPIDRNVGIVLSECNVPHGTLEDEKTYYGRMRYRDQNLRWSEWSDELSFVYHDPQGIGEENANSFSLNQNVPNPYSTTTEISFVLRKPAHVKLSVHNNSGKLLYTLIDGEQNAGSFSQTFDASHLPPGTYTYRLEVDNTYSSRKMTVVK